MAGEAGLRLAFERYQAAVLAKCRARALVRRLAAMAEAAPDEPAYARGVRLAQLLLRQAEDRLACAEELLRNGGLDPLAAAWMVPDDED